MSADWFQDVFDFHEKFRCYIGGNGPEIPCMGTPDLRRKLIREEFIELCAALQQEDMPGIADGALDLIYVVLGTLVSYGIDPRPIWDAIHAANMAKEGGGEREDGKILKPPGWTAPDVEGLLKIQGLSGE